MFISEAKIRNIIYQIVNVNDFQITDEKNNEKSEQKIINQSELNNLKLNSNTIPINENTPNDIENENDFKMLNVFYKNHKRWRICQVMKQAAKIIKEVKIFLVGKFQDFLIMLRNLVLFILLIIHILEFALMIIVIF